jgi:hypothetical protein
VASGATTNEVPAHRQPGDGKPREAAGALQAQLVSRLSDLALRGMAKVPVLANYTPSKAVVSDPILSNPTESQPVPSKVASARCDACPVCPSVDGLLQNDPTASEPGPILVILEYPASEKSIHDDLADPSSPNHLIYRLLARADLLKQSAFAYALRSPVKSLPKSQWVETCAALWLAKELQMRSPTHVLCFGARARAAYDSASKTALAKPIGKDLGSVMVHTFPSPLELTSHPTWRQGVWEEVNALTLPKS